VTAAFFAVSHRLAYKNLPGERLIRGLYYIWLSWRIRAKLRRHPRFVAFDEAGLMWFGADYQKKANEDMKKMLGKS